MARHPELCCLLISFIVAIVAKYGSSLQTKPVSMPPRQPGYMFSPESDVVDAPRGDLTPLIRLLNSEEVVVVMYYAPWCSKSQRAAPEFLKAAQYFSKKIPFAAINCWWPEGECSKRYKFLMYPVVMVYHTKLDGYRYTEVLRAEKLVRFVEDVTKAVTLVHSVTEAEDMVTQHENVVVGHFNLSSQEFDFSYRQFYYAAMRTLEKDPHQPARFAVVTQSSVAYSLGLVEDEDIVMLRLFNDTVEYPHKNNVTSSNIVQWALSNKGKLSVTRLSLDGVKSRRLADNLAKGPAFILFHVENPLFGLEPDLLVLKTVVLAFRQCLVNPTWSSVQTSWSRVLRQGLSRYQHAVRSCMGLRQSKPKADTPPSPRCCITALTSTLKRTSQVCSVCCPKSPSCSLLATLKASWPRLRHSLHNDCQHIQLSYRPSHRCSVCCTDHKGGRVKPWQSQEASHQEGRGQTCSREAGCKGGGHTQGQRSIYTVGRRATDRYVRDHLEEIPRQLCSKLVLESQQGLSDRASFPRQMSLVGTDALSLTDQFKQVGCGSNKTLNFYSIDSQSHWMFADRLSVNISWPGHPAAAVIFDKDNEEHFALQENLTVGNTMAFLLKHETGRLQRVTRSSNFPTERQFCSPADKVCLKELDANNFEEFVHKEDKDIVVLVYSHWCGFCQTFSHTFLALATYFHPSQHIRFARVNGAINDLPWRFNFDIFPSVIIFPARKKADHAVFPSGQEKSLAHLVQFVLQHATYDTRLHLAADVCSQACVHRNILRCRRRIQQLRGRATRLQLSLKLLADTEPLRMPGEPDFVIGTDEKEPTPLYQNVYANIKHEHLVKSQRDIKDKVIGLARMLMLLTRSGDQGLSKQELMGLFPVDRRKSTGG